MPRKQSTQPRVRRPAQRAPATLPAPAPALPVWLGEGDLHWFQEGRHLRLYDLLGAHPQAAATRVAVWAPNAEAVSLLADCNQWTPGSTPLSPQADSGIWSALVPELATGAAYKFAILPRGGSPRPSGEDEGGGRPTGGPGASAPAKTGRAGWIEKADPFAFRSEIAPRTASIVADLAYAWSDAHWMATRAGANAASAPISIYEVHLGSWRRVPEDGNRSLSYRELAPRLIEHLQRTGFTHAEFLPVMEHPFFGSWGYQTTGYFSPTSRYGEPQDFMFLVDQLHQHGFGVILDWVPSHFPNDPHGLANFDGTALFEHADARQGFHPDWHSCIFNYGRHEVRSFLLSNAMFWLERYHADGLRVDAVASMLYLDYSRQPGEWIPNRLGGRENLEAIELLRQLNQDLYANFPDIQTYAEESTSWPMVSRPTYLGGLGFGMKWDMGWMHDTLAYFAHDPVHRKFHHSQLTFRQLYAWQENFVLPLSHDEVVHGKASLLAKMPGDEWQRFANLRLLYGLQYGQCGKKLLFMGDEFGQGDEWNHDSSLAWYLLQYPVHAGMLQWVSDLNRAYRDIPALHQRDFDPAGFQWVDCNDAQQSTLSWLRLADDDIVLVACNFTPVGRNDFQVGVPRSGFWREVLNSDAVDYCGSGQGNLGGVWATGEAWHGQPDSILINLPPLGCVFFRHELSNER